MSRCNICDEAINLDEDVVFLGDDKSLAHQECAQGNGYCECENCKEYFDKDDMVDDGVYCCKNCMRELDSKQAKLATLKIRLVAKPVIELEWDPQTTKQHAREEQYKAKQVKEKVSKYFHELIDKLNLTTLVKEGVEKIFNSTDKEIRLAGNKLRQELQDFFKTLPAVDVQFFKNEYGSNVTDWLKNKVIAAPTSSLGTHTISSSSEVKSATLCAHGRGQCLTNTLENQELRQTQLRLKAK